MAADFPGCIPRASREKEDKDNEAGHQAPAFVENDFFWAVYLETGFALFFFLDFGLAVFAGAFNLLPQFEQNMFAGGFSVLQPGHINIF
jgi:hypothetical protein